MMAAVLRASVPHATPPIPRSSGPRAPRATSSNPCHSGRQRRARSRACCSRAAASASLLARTRHVTGTSRSSSSASTARPTKPVAPVSRTLWPCAPTSARSSRAAGVPVLPAGGVSSASAQSASGSASVHCRSARSCPSAAPTVEACSRMATTRCSGTPSSAYSRAMRAASSEVPPCSAKLRPASRCSSGARSRCAVSRSSMAASCAAYKARRTSLPVPLSVPAACEKRSCDSTTPLIRSCRGRPAAVARRPNSASSRSSLGAPSASTTATRCACAASPCTYSRRTPAAPR
mmetsp:Transcript_6214/g.18469  ORF Transcript_6214/g.18469 Transcript_6214/m.18469 type:complete len:291 (+) Transcript_6214:597-1469(+)